MKPYEQFIPNIALEKKMLEFLGVKKIGELFNDVPSKFLLKERNFSLPRPLTEREVEDRVKNIMTKNKKLLIFAGGGFYPVYVPAAVDELSSRTEFYSSYTPYASEASQGVLQALFEYQSLICEITGMDAANSSMYDWNTALGEAARMAVRINRRSKILIPFITQRDRVRTLELYIEPLSVSLEKINFETETGQLNFEDLKRKINSETSAVYVEYPNDLGIIEEKIAEISDLAHEKGALLIVGVNPLALGVLEPPGDLGADIVIGEGQPLGNHLNFGGPSLGIFACRGEREFIYQMPGRIVGMTTTLDGKFRGYTLALPTREQHIRREKATSNICTNEALIAIRTAIYLSLIGKRGFREISKNILAKTHYAIKKLRNKTNKISIPFKSLFFSEFPLKISGLKAEEVWWKMINRGVLAGRVNEYQVEPLNNMLIPAITEAHSKENIDFFVHTLLKLMREESDV